MNKLLLIGLMGLFGSTGYVQYRQYVKIKDLDFVYQQLSMNHPGFYNDQDITFKSVLQQGYDVAKKEISESYWWQDHIVILKNYLKKFHDDHLRVYKENIQLENVGDYNSQQAVFIESLFDKVSMVHIPTFMLSDTQYEQFKLVIEKIATLKNQDYIIFDVRGNSGGNSELGTRLLRSLFTKEYVDACLAKIYYKQTVWWRASLDNQKHIQELMTFFSGHKEQNADLLQWLEKVNQGILQALQDHKIFYIEKESEYTQSEHRVDNPVTAKIIVVIDESNMSACLDFITELKALTNNIVFIGHTTGADTIYMEVCMKLLPSKQGTLQYPIKMYHNRPRGNNERYNPDIVCPTTTIDDSWILNFVHQLMSNR